MGIAQPAELLRMISPEPDHEIIRRDESDEHAAGSTEGVSCRLRQAVGGPGRAEGPDGADFAREASNGILGWRCADRPVLPVRT